MKRPGNQEITPAELAKFIGGELPPALPLEGWRTVSLHCQVDAIGPSDRHPDLVKLEVSFPPVAEPRPKAAPEAVGVNCPTCGPTTLEQHPRMPGVLRCSNCKEHLATALNSRRD